MAALPAEGNQTPIEQHRRRTTGDAADPKLVGYIRVQAGDSGTLSAQRQTLQDAGCHDIVEDIHPVGRWEQPELRRLLNRMSQGDVVVVAWLGSLGASLQDVVRLLDQLDAAGLRFRSLHEMVDTTTPAGRAAVPVIASLAAFDRDLRNNRVSVGLAAAHAEERTVGRPAKLTGPVTS